jgi:hypothetical protein
MFPTFPGRGEWVLAEALPGLADRIKVGECQDMLFVNNTPKSGRKQRHRKAQEGAYTWAGCTVCCVQDPA